MYRVYACITQQHDFTLLILSALVCLFASFTALSMMTRANANSGRSRLAWLAVGSLITAVGIWATHFIAMLAFNTGLPTGYDVGLTALSLAVAAIVTGVGFGTAICTSFRHRDLAGGAIVGAGIAAMHFTGMAGLLVPATRAWDPTLVIVATGLGCGFAALAVRRVFAGKSMLGRVLAAAELTLAICAMHFTAMAALQLTPDPLVPLPEAFLRPETLAINIGLSAILVLAISTIVALVDQHLAWRRAGEAERLNRLVNATFEGIGICVDGCLIDANDALADLLKMPIGELPGRPFDHFVAPDHRKLFDRHKAAEQSSSMELRLIPAAGEQIIAELLIRRVDIDGRRAEIIAVRDVTERRAAQQKLEQYRQHLEQLVTERTAELQEQTVRLAEALDQERKLSALQRQFVSTVSHEFRTPLAIIDGNAQRLLRRPEKATPERVADSLKTITQTVMRLIRLMEDVLSSSRLEAGMIAVTIDTCALGDVIKHCCRSQREISPHHPIVEDLDRLPGEILADGKLLRQVFTNLLSNAVKFSPVDKPISIKGWHEQGHAVIVVRDQGVGIPKEQLPDMFRRFFRASTAEGIPGTGIGLHLVHELVQMHGGSISVDSDNGAGSVFTVRLPVRGPSPSSASTTTFKEEPVTVG